MKKRDIELITALAEGRLEDETQARALLAGSAALRDAYEAQVAAIAALRSLPSESLIEVERAELHREVWTRLRSGAEPSRGPAWRLNPVAAAAVLVIGAGVVFASLGGSGADFATDDRGVAAATTVPSSEENAGGEVTTDSGEGAAPQAGPEEIETFRTHADSLRTGATPPEGDGRSELCAGAEDLEGLRPIGSLQFDSRSYETWVPEDTEIGPDTPIAFVDPDTCEVVHTEE